MDKYVIIGYSGHSYVVIEAAIKAGIPVFAYTDIQEAKSNPYNLSYLGDENTLEFNGWGKAYRFILGIGDNTIRQRITKLIIDKNEELVSITHPNTMISNTSEISIGTFISTGAQVNALTRIGKSVIINTGAIIEHECVVSDFAHIAPGAVLSGNVTIGENSFIGANSVIKQGISIGNNVIVGAGTVVLANVQNGKTIVGNPGRIL